MLQNPKEDSVMGFKEEWLRFYDVLGNTVGWNHYVLVDPAGEKKKLRSMDPDYTVILVVAAAPDGNLYLVDGVRDRMSLTERTKKLFQFHRQYSPLVTAYEKYGKDSDIEHIEYVMEQENYRFNVEAVGGAMAKNDRIRRLVPDFEQGRVWLPRRLMYVDVEGKARDLVREFLDDEYGAFPVAVHDDILDCLSRVKDPETNVKYPEIIDIPQPTITLARDLDRVETEFNVFE
jgi:predicted phage terminase large subunit-like protein